MGAAMIALIMWLYADDFIAALNNIADAIRKDRDE